MTRFFDNLQEIMQQKMFSPHKIWNLDESGLSTVLQSPKVLAPAGVKQIGQAVSSERGQQVTFVGIANAAGEVAPPIYLFPRKIPREEYMEGSPEGSIGIFNGSGWMDEDAFLQTLNHIKKHTCSTKENPILLLLDNHASHCTVKAINFCRDNGIYMLSFPPHTTHKVQPLDISVFGPFKSKCKAVFHDWMSEHASASVRITIHNVVRVSAKAIPSSFSEKNIKAGFAKAGIYPLNRDLILNELENLENIAPISSGNLPLEQTVPAEQLSTETIKPSTSWQSIICSPEDIRPFPNPVKNHSAKKTSRAISSTILTSSPEKARRELIQIKKEKQVPCSCRKIKQETTKESKTKSVKRTNSLEDFDDDDSNIKYKKAKKARMANKKKTH